MKRSIWLLGLLISILIACEKDDAKPYAELPEKVRVLVDRENCECDVKIRLIKLGDQLLYPPYTTHPSCDMASLFYDQEGNVVELNLPAKQDFSENPEVIKTWSCGE